VPVQIMGVLESTALEFDHLFVLGLHAEAWPRPARPNPLLPIELQRRAGAPASGPEWELGFAQRMTEGWRRAAPQVVFCWPSAEGDRTLAASPLLAGLPGAHPAQTGAARAYRELLHQAGRLESLTDVSARPLASGVAFPGGARLIQDQAACPFRAFAAHRLGASVLEEPHEGLDARERGSVLHSAVASLWGALRTSERLAALSEDELALEIAQAVDLGLARWRARRESAFKERFLALERERLRALLREWLALERQRAPFEVLAVEEARGLGVGGVRLELRLDRVDRLGAGGALLLDYKTGEAQTGSWFDTRPDEPQLPLYALALENRPAGMAFARLARGECAFDGLAERDAIAPGVAPLAATKGRAGGWRDQLEAWRETLDALGEQFRSGVASVDPKRYPGTCELCHLRTLCRVEERVGRPVGTAPAPREDG
jgi:probable DNA repair protein